MLALLKRQEEQRKDLASGVYEQWQPIREKEDFLLSPFGGKFEKAPEDIQKEIIHGREDFFAEWGSMGRLAALMDARHAFEREKLAKLVSKIAKMLDRNNNDKDRGR